MTKRWTKAQERTEVRVYEATCAVIAREMAKAQDLDRVWWQAVNTADYLVRKGRIRKSVQVAIGDFASGCRAVLLAKDAYVNDFDNFPTFSAPNVMPDFLEEQLP